MRPLKNHTNNVDGKPIPEYIPTKSKSYSTVHTVHTVHSEKRLPVEVRMRRSIHDVIRRYCGNADMTIGEFYERSAILYMDLNPVEFFGANIIIPDRRQQNIDDQLREIISVEELKDFIDKTAVLKKPFHISKKKEAISILKECSKINNRSEELETLIREVMNLIN